MTGLPEEAHTTGTVTTANGGRVTMVTFRSMNAGYPWMDTLAHELTHVAVGMGGPRAPLAAGGHRHALREALAPGGCLRRPSFTGRPRLGGLRDGLARKFDEIGPSVALLPSPAQAMVVYAQVRSINPSTIGDFEAKPQPCATVGSKNFELRLAQPGGVPHDTHTLMEVVGSMERLDIVLIGNVPPYVTQLGSE